MEGEKDLLEESVPLPFHCTTERTLVFSPSMSWENRGWVGGRTLFKRKSGMDADEGS